MEEKIRLSVMGITYSPMQSGAFAMLLAEEDGPKRIPVVIGSAEAQSIAIKLEGVVTPRPLTHDLFVQLANAYGLRLTEVFIYKFEDGIFSSELRFTDGQKDVQIDSRTSDAVAIAVRTGAPIYTTRKILDEVGTIFDEKEEQAFQSGGDSDQTGSQDDKSKGLRRTNPEQMSDAELQSLLDKLIADENYEVAAKINEILKKRKQQ